MSSFNKGIVYIIIGSFWWGVIGVIYFRSLSFVGSIELVLHRVIWTAVMLIITTLYMSKWTKIKKIFKNKEIYLIMLVRCIECEGEVSDKAVSYPKCGIIFSTDPKIRRDLFKKK